MSGAEAMSDPHFALTLAAAALAGLAMLLAAALTGWRGWLQLQLERAAVDRSPAPPNASARIELADLRERIRKLEAIAAGVEL